MTEEQPPVPEVPIDDALVRRLLAAQVPELADLPLERVRPGWDNVVVRVGDAHAVRLPRRAVAAPLVLNEQRWLPVLAPRLPLPVPEPRHRGRPGCGYPWAWSVVPWLSGEVAGSDASLGPAAAHDLGGFLAALHRPAPADAPRNPHRGISLSARAEVDRARIAVLDGDGFDGDELEECRAHHAALDPWDGPRVWLHGDLHPLNLLVAGGRVSGVIDWGDVCSGDPATDLAVAWMVLDHGAWPTLREAAGIDDGTWLRGRGWALAMALAFAGDDGTWNDFQGLGRRLLVRVLDSWRA